MKATKSKEVIAWIKENLKVKVKARDVSYWIQNFELSIAAQ